MIIHHRLADRTATDSVDGMVISASEHKELYELINEVMKGGEDGESPIRKQESFDPWETAHKAVQNLDKH